VTRQDGSAFRKVRLLVTLFSLGAVTNCSLGSKQSRASNKPAVDKTPLPGMPPVLDPDDVYSADRAGDLSPVVRRFPARIYVPNSGSNTVDIINPRT